MIAFSNGYTYLKDYSLSISKYNKNNYKFNNTRELGYCDQPDTTTRHLARHGIHSQSILQFQYDWGGYV